MSKGIDYAFSPHPSVAAMKANGVVFVCRYTSAYPPNDKNGKNLVASEKTSLLANGFSIVLVAEEGSNRMLGGKAAGLADAKHADAVVKSLGMPGLPIYFACDWDASPNDQVSINAYLDGVSSVIGRGRTGIYGGFYPVKRALDGGHAAYAWQTYAWSGGQWDARAQIRQTKNGQTISGASIDWDESRNTDYGQWPRPGAHPVLSSGNAGAAVSALQTRLNVHGAKITVDGSFGPPTLAAVKAFQRSHVDAAGHVLTADGVVGPATWAALEASPVPDGPVPYSPPSGLAVTRTTISVLVSWHALTAAGKPVPTYTVNAVGDDGHVYASAIVTGTSTVLSGLRVGWHYDIRVWGNGGPPTAAFASVKITA